MLAVAHVSVPIIRLPKLTAPLQQPVRLLRRVLLPTLPNLRHRRGIHLEQGVNVIMLEAAPIDDCGGNSRYTGGLMRVVYNGVDDLAQIIPELTEDDLQPLRDWMTNVGDARQEYLRAARRGGYAFPSFLLRTSNEPTGEVVTLVPKQRGA